MASEVGSARARARPATALLMVRVVTIVPITAMPSALPTWRMVELVPLATPDLSGGIFERTTLVSCVVAKPAPIP